MTKLYISPDGWVVRFLITQPDNVFGFQWVIIELKDARVTQQLLAFNAETIELPGGFREITEADIEKISVAGGECCAKPFWM